MSDQLSRKDDQIEKLNENVHKQTVHIQTLIQENNKLNMKLLLEIT
jgi:regulator of replication initiation timing